MLHDQSPFFIGLGYRLNFKYDIVWYINKSLSKNSIGDFLSKASKILRKVAVKSSKSQRQENMHNKFVERKCKSIINPLSISDHKKL